MTEKKSSVQPTTQRLRSLSMVMVVEPFAKRKSRHLAANSKGKRQRTISKTYRKTETSSLMSSLRGKMTEKDETSHSDACKQEAHYWILDDKSFGVCKKCGAEKQFPAAGVFGWQNRNIVIGKAPHRPTH